MSELGKPFEKNQIKLKKQKINVKGPHVTKPLAKNGNLVQTKN